MDRFEGLDTGLLADDTPRPIVRVNSTRIPRDRVYRMWANESSKLAEIADKEKMTVPEWMRANSPAMKDANTANDKWDPFADMLVRDDLRVQSVDGVPASFVKDFLQTETGQRAFVMRIDDVFDRTLKNLLFTKADATLGSSVDGLDSFENRAIAAPVVQNPFGLPISVAAIAGRVDPIPSTRWTRPNILSNRGDATPVVVRDGARRPYVTLDVGEDDGRTQTLASGVGWTDEFATSEMSMDVVNAEVAVQAQAAERLIANEGILEMWNNSNTTALAANADLDGIIQVRYHSDGGYNYNIHLGNQSTLAKWTRANIQSQVSSGGVAMLSPTRVTGALPDVSIGTPLASGGPRLYYWVGGPAGTEGVDIVTGSGTNEIPANTLLTLDLAQGLVLKVCRQLEADRTEYLISRGITVRRRTWNYGWDFQKRNAMRRWTIT